MKCFRKKIMQFVHLNLHRKVDMDSPLLSKADDHESDALHYLPTPTPISLSLESVSYKVPRQQSFLRRCCGLTPPAPLEILSNVSCYVKPQAMVAVLGSSGAGKTTLLDILADRNKSGVLSGKLFINDVERCVV